eukprot:scaffold9114_cov118-Isochrysis_galbana.AAC.22
MSMSSEPLVSSDREKELSLAWDTGWKEKLPNDISRRGFPGWVWLTVLPDKLPSTPTPPAPPTPAPLSLTAPAWLTRLPSSRVPASGSVSSNPSLTSVRDDCEGVNCTRLRDRAAMPVIGLAAGPRGAPEQPGMRIPSRPVSLARTLRSRSVNSLFCSGPPGAPPPPPTGMHAAGLTWPGSAACDEGA